MVRNGKTFYTKKHRPNDPKEKERIENLGGFIENNSGKWELNGCLPMSRAIGIKKFKRFLTPKPDVSEYSLENDDLIILASDGLWNVISDKEVVKFVHKELDIQKNLQTIAEKLAQNSRNKGSKNDITVIIYQHSKNKQNQKTVDKQNNNAMKKGNKQDNSKKKKRTKILTGTAVVALLIFLYYNYFYR